MSSPYASLLQRWVNCTLIYHKDRDENSPGWTVLMQRNLAGTGSKYNYIILIYVCPVQWVMLKTGTLTAHNVGMKKMHCVTCKFIIMCVHINVHVHGRKGFLNRSTFMAEQQESETAIVSTHRSPGGILGKLRSEVPKSSMRRSNSGGGANILGKLRYEAHKSSMRSSESCVRGGGDIFGKLPDFGNMNYLVQPTDGDENHLSEKQSDSFIQLSEFWLTTRVLNVTSIMILVSSGHQVFWWSIMLKWRLPCSLPSNKCRPKGKSFVLRPPQPTIYIT